MSSNNSVIESATTANAAATAAGDTLNPDWIHYGLTGMQILTIFSVIMGCSVALYLAFHLLRVHYTRRTWVKKPPVAQGPGLIPYELAEIRIPGPFIVQEIPPPPPLAYYRPHKCRC
ncbi:hypothetical protein QBC33DRAFT_557578 [Phialemonium atrogriseum]|uniref:Uncharacterized protein n=1 Tax=Phialemonium atrogriseum TaxID=1093897 RepID=A0AAJ0C4Z2_9PEZI|nr:uncharacterized protein QBC33DRAFT_557578 [Phialemonium atrogriseum]KAK1768814.1 hypothetical protein QBC33DRAFT_557578 [Phialemonium atrogriseum]